MVKKGEFNTVEWQVRQLSMVNSPMPDRRGWVLAYGFPLTEFGGFHGPSSANSKLFHWSEFPLVKDRGNNKNSSSIV